MPHEWSFFGVYVSPWLVAGTLGSLLAALSAWALNRTRLSRFFRFHQWTFLFLVVIYTCLLGRFGAGL
ncbi:MAG TPA: DUF1656 domain-containing protein [Candidatus Mailhella merdigallinarum]|uniref:DUF1656 domain-containing protein n=1 Tax=Candidatus Mailhella merdigallinarum TaxID=2838658 RepID=A0A9D2HCS0_9BACT|nr:DUF1656 domain-containing protein [Desulfovibrionaceae bacterium]HJA08037.1 DUF1656 domain-containing protein [Candidatus Mailhella merdigallinarum]